MRKAYLGNERFFNLNLKRFRIPKLQLRKL